MMRHASLVRIWLALMVLTALAMFFGHVGAQARLAGWEVALLLVLSGLKARLVLEHYLELKPGNAWHGALTGSTVVLAAAILALALVA